MIRRPVAWRVGWAAILAGGTVVLGLWSPALRASADTGPVRDLLPDLQALPRTDATFFGVSEYGATVNGCFADEMAEQGARRCLRLGQQIANFGDGPFELRYAPPDYLTEPTMYQVISRSDGTTRERAAETYEFHPTHAHFHYSGFAQTLLWRSNPSGDRLGSAALRTGRKNGFCVFDSDRVLSDAPTAQYSSDTCRVGIEPRNGVTPGWSDVYTASLPGQYVEVSGVPDGFYLLESRADPDNTVVEVDETNNHVAVLLRLEGDTVEHLGVIDEPPRRADLTSPHPSSVPPAVTPVPAQATAKATLRLSHRRGRLRASGAAPARSRVTVSLLRGTRPVRRRSLTVPGSGRFELRLGTVRAGRYRARMTLQHDGRAVTVRSRALVVR